MEIWLISTALEHSISAFEGLQRRRPPRALIGRKLRSSQAKLFLLLLILRPFACRTASKRSKMDGWSWMDVELWAEWEVLVFWWWWWCWWLWRQEKQCEIAFCFLFFYYYLFIFLIGRHRKYGGRA